MKPFLLDVNLLIALLWDRHEHHTMARAWFMQTGQRAWATATLTELGFIRISANPRFSPAPAGTHTAAAALRVLRQRGQHRFLGELPHDALADLYARAAVNHAAVTDLYLARLCAHHNAILATLDRGIASLASRVGLDAEVFTLSPAPGAP